MKKISLLLALMLTMCSFAACGDSDDDDDDDRKSRSSAVSDNDEDDDDKKDDKDNDRKGGSSAVSDNDENDDDKKDDKDDDRKSGSTAVSDNDEDDDDKDDDNKDDDRKSGSTAVSDNDEDDDDKDDDNKDDDNDDDKNDEKSVKLSRGKVNGSTYTNDSCGLSFEAPEDWHIYSEAEIKATMNAGLEVGGNTNVDTDMLMQKTTYDFVAGDLSTGETIMIMIEDLSKYPDGFTIDDYIKAAKLSTTVAMPNADIDWKVDGEHETVCGIEFDVFGLDIEIKDYGVAITQDYYLSKIDDCLLVLTYSSGTTGRSMNDYSGCFKG